MRVLLLVVLVACGSSKPQQQQPMSNQVAARPVAPEPVSACGCTSERCREDSQPRWVKALVCSYRERMCACHDKACADGVNADFTRWMERMAKDAKPEAVEAFKEEDAKQVADDVTKYQECYTHVVGASDPTPP